MGWRYEGLFETLANPEATDLLNWYRSQPSTIQVGKMGYRRSVTLAGPRLECDIYPVFGRQEEGRARKIKQNQTSEKQKRLNTERAIRHLIQLADANFTDRDVHLTLTYRGDPPDYERCRKDVRNFLNRVKRYRKKMGIEELKFIYVIEGGWDNSTGYGKERIHVHMMMNRGVGREDLEAMWANGYANADRLQPNERGLEELSRYFMKHRDKGRKYGASRNLKQPQTRKSDVKTSNRTVRLIAQDIRNEAKAEMEKLYKSYQFVDCKVYYSDQLEGVYIRVLMRRRDRKETNRPGGRRSERRGEA